jgi:hypothetical protein
MTPLSSTTSGDSWLTYSSASRFACRILSGSLLDQTSRTHFNLLSLHQPADRLGASHMKVAPAFCSNRRCNENPYLNVVEMPVHRASSGTNFSVTNSNVFWATVQALFRFAT